MSETKLIPAPDRCRQMGIKNLTELSRITGRSVHTLRRWYAQQPEFFEVVLAGAVAKKSNGGQNEISQ